MPWLDAPLFIFIVPTEKTRASTWCTLSSNFRFFFFLLFFFFGIFRNIKTIIYPHPNDISYYSFQMFIFVIYRKTIYSPIEYEMRPEHGIIYHANCNCTTKLLLFPHFEWLILYVRKIARAIYMFFGDGYRRRRRCCCWRRQPIHIFYLL